MQVSQRKRPRCLSFVLAVQNLDMDYSQWHWPRRREEICQVSVQCAPLHEISFCSSDKFSLLTPDSTRHGMHVCLADINADGLKEAEAKVAQIIPKENILSVVTDVSSLDQVERLRDEAMAKFGEVGDLFADCGLLRGPILTSTFVGIHWPTARLHGSMNRTRMLPYLPNEDQRSLARSSDRESRGW